MFSKNRKYFRFRFTLVWTFVLSPSPTYQSAALTVPYACKEVASYLKDWNGGKANSPDVKFLKNSIICIQGLYKIYEKTDWKVVQKKFPQNVRDLVREVRNTTSIAKDKEIGFLAVYMLYRAFDIFDQAMSLDLDYLSHREEFHMLQLELKDVTNVINNQLIPLRDHLDWATLRVITYPLLKKLSHINAALKQLVQTASTSSNESAKKRWVALALGLVSTLVCAGVLLVGSFIFVVACAAIVLSVTSFVSLSWTVYKIDWLIHDMEKMAEEIENTGILLEQMSTCGVSELSLVVTIIVGLWLLFHQNAQVPQDHQAMADLQ